MAELGRIDCLPGYGKVALAAMIPVLSHTLFPMVDILRYGGSLPVSQAGDFRFCCPDADVINVFRVEMISSKTE